MVNASDITKGTKIENKHGVWTVEKVQSYGWDIARIRYGSYEGVAMMNNESTLKNVRIVND